MKIMNRINLDRSSCGLVLKILSTTAGGIYAGGAFYLSVVEAPARMTHDAPSSITMWKPSFVRAKNFQSSLVLLSGLSAVGAYSCLRDQSDIAMRWLVAGTTMLSVLPFTLIFIRPINHELVKTEKCISVKGDDWIIETLTQWDKLHSVRTLLSLSAFGMMMYALAG